jgi:hypothetical protein
VQIKQVQPELSCNAVLEQAPGWESASDSTAMKKYVLAGQESVAGTYNRIRLNFMP